MKVSVVISTYNSPAWLEKVLWGYECQTHKDFEIVIADDGSGDETKQLIDRFMAQTALKLFMSGMSITDFKNLRFSIKLLLPALQTISFSPMANPFPAMILLRFT